jgi:DNA-binding FrmR family transcriptional regulator
MKANHALVKKRLNLAKGQIEGILRMVDDDRYCIDISQQLLAAIALLKQANRLVLKAHLDSCVREASGAEVSEKIQEIMSIMEKMNQ